MFTRFQSFFHLTMYIRLVADRKEIQLGGVRAKTAFCALNSLQETSLQTKSFFGLDLNPLGTETFTLEKASLLDF